MVSRWINEGTTPPWWRTPKNKQPIKFQTHHDKRNIGECFGPTILCENNNIKGINTGIMNRGSWCGINESNKTGTKADSTRTSW